MYCVLHFLLSPFNISAVCQEAAELGVSRGQEEPPCPYATLMIFHNWLILMTVKRNNKELNRSFFSPIFVYQRWNISFWCYFLINILILYTTQKLQKMEPGDNQVIKKMTNYLQEKKPSVWLQRAM